MKLQCPTCGSRAVATELREERCSVAVPVIPRVSVLVDVTAKLPVRICTGCGYQWTDDEAVTVLTASIAAEQKRRGVT